MYVPRVQEELKPYIGQKFKSIDDAHVFYDNYARASGFDTRKHGSKTESGVVMWVYVVCSREGQKKTVDEDTSNAREGFTNKRRRASKRCECKARISFKFESECGVSSYVVKHFVEEHNHDMVEECHKRFMTLNRTIDNVHRKFIVDCAKANIGPTMTFKLLNELLGGLDYVGCTVVEVRNFSRDMKAFAEGSDAQMLLLEMHRKKEACDGFVYEYELDNEDKLKRIFWSDAIGRRNFHMFGDVVAFDTTYYTNRYCMIFGPFTGKDNHGNPVNFGAGLICKEDADTFSWLFKQFVQCMGVAPKLIITDQDLGMKVAIERVLVGTRHRWCMWHIMLKLTDKVPKPLLANDDFKRELNECVWSEVIEPDEFENSWKVVMQRYDLENEEWFKNMFDLKQYWVPAYFRDLEMGSLLRTTSVSESENSFFKKYTKPRSNLLEFIMNYNHALDAQRNQSAKLDYKDSTNIPILATDLPIEKHAATIYTDNMFKVVQKEIVEACFQCRMTQMSCENDNEIYEVVDSSRKSFIVRYDVALNSYVCACKLYVRMGILCCHIFFVLKNKDAKLIPEKLYGGRWMKTSLIKAVHDVFDDYSGTTLVVNDNKIALNKLYSTFFGLVNRIERNIEHISMLTAAIDDVVLHIFGGEPIMSTVEKKRVIEKFYGTTRPDVVNVHLPNVVKTKGSGSRLISRKEKALRIMNKPARRCAKCGELGHHDARNCEKLKEKSKTQD